MGGREGDITSHLRPPTGPGLGHSGCMSRVDALSSLCLQYLLEDRRLIEEYMTCAHTMLPTLRGDQLSAHCPLPDRAHKAQRQTIAQFLTLPSPPLPFVPSA